LHWDWSGAGAFCGCDWQHVHGVSAAVRFKQQQLVVLACRAGSQAQAGNACQPATNAAAAVTRHRLMRDKTLIFIPYPRVTRYVKGICGQARSMDRQDPMEKAMPKLTVEDVGTFDVPAGKRLVLALEDEARIDQLHACGGNARCTTCRVEFISGEPPTMTEAERQVLAARGLTGVRLSCQILTDHDMTVRAISRFAGSGRKDVGPRPADTIPS